MADNTSKEDQEEMFKPYEMGAHEMKEGCGPWAIIGGIGVVILVTVSLLGYCSQP